MARIVYQTLKEERLTDKAVAKGLHKATRYVRNEHKSANQRGITSMDSKQHDGPWEVDTGDYFQDVEKELEAFEISDNAELVSREKRDAVPVCSCRRQEDLNLTSGFHMSIMGHKTYP